MFSPSLEELCQLRVWVLSHYGHACLFATLWTLASQALLSFGFPRQEYGSGLPFPSPNPGIEPMSLMFPPLESRFFTTSTTWETLWVAEVVAKSEVAKSEGGGYKVSLHISCSKLPTNHPTNFRPSIVSKLSLECD